MKKKGLLILAAAAFALIAVCGARPAYKLYRDISFGWTEHTQAEYAVKAFAEEKGISYGEYPQALLDLYQRNPETEDFVLNYPFRVKGEAELTGCERDTVPLLLQWDPSWGYEKYGSGCIGITGCGPTCLSMVGYYLTGDASLTPGAVAKFAEKEGYYASGYGSSWRLISEGAGKLGLSARELPLVKGKMVNALEAGEPIILALGPGDFTSSGHYIVLTGIEDGLFRVNDPNSRINSEKLWSYEQLEGQIRNIWAIGKG